MHFILRAGRNQTFYFLEEEDQETNKGVFTYINMKYFRKIAQHPGKFYMMGVYEEKCM